MIFRIVGIIKGSLRIAERNVVSLLDFVSSVKVLFWNCYCVPSGLKFCHIDCLILVWRRDQFSPCLGVIKWSHPFAFSSKIKKIKLTLLGIHDLVPFSGWPVRYLVCKLKVMVCTFQGIYFYAQSYHSLSFALLLAMCFHCLRSYQFPIYLKVWLSSCLD